VAVGLVIAPQLLRGTRPFPVGLLGPLGFLGLVVLSLPGLVQASTLSVSVEFVVKTALSAAFLWTFFFLAKGKNDVFIIFQRAFFILSALTLILLVMLIWDTTVGDAHLWGSISVEGLGYSRYIVGLGLRPAGWSLGTALFVPIAALVFLSRPAQWRWDRKIFAVAAVMVFVASQIVSGGRVGILLSVLAIAGFAFLPSTRRLAAILLLVCLLPYSIVCLNTCCKLHLHLDRIPGVGGWLF